MELLRTARLGIAAVLLVLAAAGCGSSDSGSETSGSTGSPSIRVEAAFYPLQWVATRVGGDAVEVSNLTPSGAEPHDLELTPRAVAALSDADLVFYLAGFQPAVDKAVEGTSTRAFDATTAADLDLAFEGEDDHGHDDDDDHVEDDDHADEDEDGTVDGHTEDEEHAEDADHIEGDDHDEAGSDADHAEDQEAHDEGDGHDHGPVDPHFWLDPMRLAAVADAFAAELGEIAPESAASFQANAQDLRADLEALDADLSDGLATCESRDIVTSHEAFGYLADRYDLTQVGIAGLRPSEEPSPSDLAAVVDFVEENDVRTIYFETLVSPAVAETIASETGAATAVLDPIEGLTDASDGDDYLEVMRSNLASLQAGQPCP